MSRILKVNNGDYRIIVSTPTPTQETPTITLDTGNQVGKVIVTGDLTVLGNTTTVASETVTIKDNIIYLNSGEGGAGITLNTSGIQIDRGSLSDAQFLFDEDFGTFVSKDTTGAFVGIRTNSIRTGGVDLNLINEGTGLVTVAGTTNYHLNVQASADLDVLVTRAWVEGYVLATGNENGGQGVALTDRIARDNTGIQAYDNVPDGGTSNIKFKFDNVVKATFTASSFNINSNLDISGKTLISDNVISAQTAGDNLKLVPAVGKSIEIDSPIQLNDTTAPPAITDATKIYTLSSDNASISVHPGDTGIYFTSLTRSDELVSKSRALLMSMLF